MGLFRHRARALHRRALTILALLAAGVLVLTAACASSGTSSGSGSAGTPAGTSVRSGSASAPLTPRQFLLAAATQAQRATSATEALTISDSGASRSTVTGIIQFQLKPILLISENLDTTAAGVSTPVKAIVTSTDMYIHEASLTSQVGEPWVEMDLSALSAQGGSTGAGLAQFFRSLQGNEFSTQAQLFTAAQNARVVGTQTVDGVPTTEYAGSFTAAAARTMLPASLRQAFAAELNALGDGTVSFREWIDGQHRLRKLAETEVIQGSTVSTTMNITAVDQPVHITLPPASQVSFIPGSGGVSGNSFTGNLAAAVIAAPSGYALSQNQGEHSGPVNAAGLNSYMGSGNPAAEFHFTRGYQAYYDGPGGDVIAVSLFQFATQDNAVLFADNWAPAGPASTAADPVIPGAEDFNSTVVQQGSAEHGVLAVKGNITLIVDDVTSSTAPVPLTLTIARQQYAALLLGRRTHSRPDQKELVDPGWKVEVRLLDVPGGTG